jgi:hypothetical protein
MHGCVYSDPQLNTDDQDQKFGGDREKERDSPKSFPSFFFLPIGREKETNQSTKLYQMESRVRK